MNSDVLSPDLLRAMALPLTRLHVPFVSARLARRVQRLQTTWHVMCRLHGLKWNLDLAEMIDFNIYYLRSYERFTIRRVLQCLEPGGTFFDVGANIGYFTLRAARRVGPAGRVCAFEPMGRVYDKLVEHVHLNGLANVTTERVIVTDRSRGRQTVAFRNSWKMFGRPPDPQALEEVDSVSLDEYVRRTGIARLDAMKIDVDGYEYKVLTGARETLVRFQPVLMLEIGAYTLRSAGDSLEELIDFLHALGYEFFSEITLRRYRTARQLLAAVPDDATINVVCRRRTH